MTSFMKPKKQAKVIRLVGDLIVEVNGQPVKVSNTFKVQTDIAYSGMTLAEQDTVLKAIETALAGNADIKFRTDLRAEEVKTNAKSREPSELDLILEEANKPKQVDLVEAVVRDDDAVAASKQSALDILGSTSLDPAFTLKQS